MSAHARLDENLPELSAEVRRLGARRLGDLGTGNGRIESPPVQFPDPVHSIVSLPEGFAGLVEHPLFQRLHDVRQLPFAFPAFPGGTHTRLAHSLGVAHLATDAMRGVLEAGYSYSGDGRNSLKIDPGEGERLLKLSGLCALLHDIAHPPLGHTLDRFFSSRFPDIGLVADKGFLPETVRRLEEPIRQVGSGLTAEDVIRVLGENQRTLLGWEPFIRALVDSELDVDRCDYLQRDAHFTGQQEGLLNLSRLLSGIRPFSDHDRVFLAFDISVLPEIEQFVYAREVMYLRCYERSEKVVSEGLVLRAMHLLFRDHPELGGDLDFFRVLTDPELRELVESSRAGGAKDLLRRVYNSDARHYRPIASAPFEVDLLEDHLRGLRKDFTRRRATLLDTWELLTTTLAEEAELDPNDLLLALPDLRLSDERNLALHIRLLIPDGGGFRTIQLLNEASDESPSELLQRLRYISEAEVQAATDLEELKERARRTGISLLHLLRRPRNRLKLYLHNRAMDRADAARDAFRSLGIPSGVDLGRIG